MCYVFLLGMYGCFLKKKKKKKNCKAACVANVRVISTLFSTVLIMGACGEFVAHLSLDDIAIDDKKSPSVVQVNIKQSKTDPFRQGVQVYLGKTGKALCPVEALLPYLAIRGANPGPLFILKDGSYLTRQRFASLISTCLCQAGIDEKSYSTHSFRIGAATTAKDAGISDVHIHPQSCSNIN